MTEKKESIYSRLIGWFWHHEMHGVAWKLYNLAEMFGYRG